MIVHVPRSVGRRAQMNYPSFLCDIRSVFHWNRQQLPPPRSSNLRLPLVTLTKSGKSYKVVTDLFNHTTRMPFSPQLRTIAPEKIKAVVSPNAISAFTQTRRRSGDVSAKLHPTARPSTRASTRIEDVPSHVVALLQSKGIHS